VLTASIIAPQTLVNFPEATLRNIPAGCHLHAHRRENLKYELFSTYDTNYMLKYRMFGIEHT
jgi:hypothetical protein